MISNWFFFSSIDIIMAPKYTTNAITMVGITNLFDKIRPPSKRFFSNGNDGLRKNR